MNDKDVTTVPNAHSAPPAALCAVRARTVDPDTEVVAADGELDLDSAPMLKWAIAESFATGHRRVVVDLSEVSFIDSTSIGVLVAIRRKLADDQRLAVGGVAGATLEVFRQAGMERAFRLYPTVEAAIADLDASEPRAER